MKLYQVGGSVRDKLIDPKSKPKDIDYAVVVENYSAMKEELLSQGYKIFLEKPEYLIIRAKKDKEVIDFAMCREDGVYSNARHPDIVKPCSIETDLFRRDFTVNSIAIDEDGNILDPYNGQEDIRTMTLRCVEDTKERLAEDALRILRAFRFCITKGFTFDENLHKALQDPELYALLSVVSKERKREELMKMTQYNTIATLRLLSKYPEELTEAIFTEDLWLKPTYEKRKRV